MTDNPDPKAAPNDATPAGAPVAPIPTEPDYLQPPRLGIIHLLAWTAVAAVLFKGDAASRLLAKERMSDLSGNLLQQVAGLLDLTLIAAGIMGLAVLACSRLRRQPGRFAPGHWILIGMIPDMLFYVIYEVWHFSYLLHEGTDFAETIWLVYLLNARG